MEASETFWVRKRDRVEGKAEKGEGKEAGQCGMAAGAGEGDGEQGG